MSQQEPQYVEIGTVNKKLEQFNDLTALTKCGGYQKINAIRVYYTEKYVRGFEIFYKLNDGDLLKAGHNTPRKRKELKSAVFEIGPDDYLCEIQGCFVEEQKRNKIVNITFLTYRGKAGTFGGTGPKQFGFSFPGHTFGAFSGGFKKNIEWLNIKVDPLPESFLKDFQKVQVNVVIQGSESGKPYNAFAAVQMPKISMGNQAPQTYPNQVATDNVNLLSSKYPTFGSQPTQPQGQATNPYAYSAQAQVPQPFTPNSMSFQAQYGGGQQQPQSYQYPLQMNQQSNPNPYNQAQQYPQQYPQQQPKQ